MLMVRGVHKAYGSVQALRGVDLEVGRGEIVALVGPNGAGKTSLVSIVAGLRRPDQGEVTVGGLDVTKHRQEVGRLLGLAPQELAIYPTITVRDNLPLAGELAGLRGAALKQRIDETAASLGIHDLLDRVASAMSGGQRRRLHTAMALVHRPPLLLLDEPTVGADIDSRAQLLDLVRRLAHDDGAAVCYSTHYLPEVEELGATVAILEQGRVVTRGTLPELLAAHARPAVELEFRGPAPHLSGFPDAIVDGPRLRIAADDPAAAAADALAALGPDHPPLAGVEVLHPGLEAVYRAVTGRRFEEDEEVVDAVA
jgi:ABC-2 type transport system ATP-binding protein